MKKLFNIESFSFSSQGTTISVITDKKNWLLDKALFEEWVDRREYRLVPNTLHGGVFKCSWEDFYKDCGEDRLYSYIIIQSSWSEDLWAKAFGSIEKITGGYKFN